MQAISTAGMLSNRNRLIRRLGEERASLIAVPSDVFQVGRVGLSTPALGSILRAGRVALARRVVVSRTASVFRIHFSSSSSSESALGHRAGLIRRLHHTGAGKPRPDSVAWPIITIVRDLGNLLSNRLIAISRHSVV